MITGKMMAALSDEQRRLISRALHSPLIGALCDARGESRTARCLMRRGFGAFDEESKRFTANDATRVAWTATTDAKLASPSTSAKGAA